MSVPLSDSELAEIRERARRMIADKVTYAPVQYAEDYSVLLAEVDRLRACDCFPNPSDHADRCPIFIAAFPESGENW